MQRRKFSREFKLEAVRLIKDRGVAVAQAARDLDVHENVLRKWVRELRDFLAQPVNLLLLRLHLPMTGKRTLRIGR